MTDMLNLLDDAGLVRPMERHDLPVVAGLAARRARLLGDPLGGDPHDFAASMRAPGARVHGLVAERFGHVVGYALLRLAGELRGDAMMDQLFVLESSRGLGLGRRLVEAATALAHREGQLRLRVAGGAAQPRGGAFLVGCGFAVAGSDYLRAVV